MREKAKGKGIRLKNTLRLIASTKPHAAKIAQTAVSVMLKYISTSAAALLAARMVSLSITGGLSVDFWKYMAPLCVCVAVRALTYFGEMYFGHDAAYRIQRDTRVEIYRKLDKLAPAFTGRSHSAQLGSVAMGDIELLEWFIAHTFGNLISAAAITAIFTAVLFVIDARIGGLVLAFAAIIAAIPQLGARLADAQGAEVRALNAKANSVLIEGIQGINDYVALDYTQSYETKRRERLDAFYRARYEYGKRVGWENGTATFFAGLFTVLIMLLCAKLVSAGEMTREMYPIMLVLSTFVFTPLLEVSASARGLGEMFAAADRIQRIFDEEPEVKDEGSVTSLSEHPDIRFEHVCFEYDAGKPVLKDVCFTVPAGKQVAIVGPSGAGKTTCLNLLLRYWDAQRGSVQLGGVDVRNLKLSTLRSVTSAVLQDVFLFHISVMENIRMGRPDATDEEVIEAAKKASAHEFISALPDGYDTVTGERGFRLSGGQRQRISIARAFLRNAPILVLDEAVSSLDAETEALIEKVLREDAGGRTTMVIAHRLSTIMNADLLVVICDGKIVQTGCHEELIRQEGFYKTLMERQLKGNGASEDGRPELAG